MWSQTYLGSVAYDLVETSDGGFALAGELDDDVLLIKTDSSGNMEWNQTYGEAHEEYATSLVTTSDGGFALCARTDSFGAGLWDFWLIKTDAQGNMEWNQTYGGPEHDYPHTVIETSDGGFALAGFTFSFGAGEDDVWLVKTDSQGNMQWNKTYGGTDGDRAKSLVETSDGGFALAGITRSFDVDSGDFWLIKTDSHGNEDWSKTYGGDEWEDANALVETSDGGYALAGVTFPDLTEEFWLVKTDQQGNMQWNQTYGGANQDLADALVESSDGGFAIVGRSSSFDPEPHSSFDFWLIKTDASGNEKWNQTYGEPAHAIQSAIDIPHALIETSDGGFAMTGKTTSYGPQNCILLIKTDQTGVIPEFAPWLFLPLFAVSTLVAVFVYKRLTTKPDNHI
ncbi:MAG: hypothetical protein NWF03_08645 [Candidatus Bathyarchaeota archaeon]|nr:hypothetical protein [Candidatus Bathyarchaeota archaeon]